MVKFNMKSFFSARCRLPVEILPTITNASCNAWCRTTDMVTGTAVSGSCESQFGFGSHLICPVNTTIRLNVLRRTFIYVGTPYLTCTEDGWFPLPPRHDNFRVGKLNVFNVEGKEDEYRDE